MISFLAMGLALAFPILVLAAAFKDAVSYTIPNSINLGLIALFPLAALSAGVGLPALGLHAALGAGALVVGMGMFAMRWVGGGDAKLFAAAALWLGWPAGAQFLMVTAFAGAGLSLALITMRSQALRPMILLGPQWAQRLAEPGGAVPYGLAIAAGALAAFPRSPFGALLGL
jgi:prepilin peptidase CpaA